MGATLENLEKCTDVGSAVKWTEYLKCFHPLDRLDMLFSYFVTTYALCRHQSLPWNSPLDLFKQYNYLTRRIQHVKQRQTVFLSVQ